LAAAWSSSPHNLLLLPECGPTTATWLQQCCDAGSLPPQHHWHWKVQYAPLTGPLTADAITSSSSSTAPGRAGQLSEGVGDISSRSQGGLSPWQWQAQGSLTAGELLVVLLHSSDSNGVSQVQSGAGGGRGCQVLGCDSDIGQLEAALQQQRLVGSMQFSHDSMMPVSRWLHAFFMCADSWRQSCRQHTAKSSRTPHHTGLRVCPFSQLQQQSTASNSVGPAMPSLPQGSQDSWS
jgi:hypothetical protein